MKRYLLFVYEKYYPSGGMHDFVGSFDSVGECLSAFTIKKRMGFQIFDSIKSKIIVTNNEESFW